MVSINAATSVLKTIMRKAYMNGACYSGLSSLLDPVFGGVGAILMLHHVHPETGPPLILNRELHIDPYFLEQMIEDLRAHDVQFVSMDETADRLKYGYEDELFVSVTLDDGYRDNFQYAVPVFRAHDIPYTIFVSPGLVDGTADFWWERLQAIIETNDSLTYETPGGTVTRSCATPFMKRYTYYSMIDYCSKVIDEDAQRALVAQLCEAYGIDADERRRDTVMDWDELRTLAGDPLATIGAHTMNHFHLRRLNRVRADREMSQSADVIEEKTSTRPKHLAYPYGNRVAAGPREVEMARAAGFTTAVTTRHGLLRSGHAANLHALPRISVNGYYQQMHYVHTMLTGITVPAANYGRTFITV